ncbi:MAG: flagellar biosynthetic protein FliO [Pseudomonadota bacterium]
MTQALLSVVAFVALLALVPWAIKWAQRRAGGGAMPGATGTSRVVSAVGVGPQQRVVTVEVGSPTARTWLVLGVTAQSITVLHSQPAPGFAEVARLADGAAGESPHV